MSRSLFSNYGTNVYPRPHDDIDPRNKDQRWHLDWCKYIFGYGSRDDNSTPYSQYHRIEQNRAYADGRQDKYQYTSRFYDEVGRATGLPIGQTDIATGDDTLSGRNQRREGYMNINDDILPIFPKYLSLLIGKFAGVDHDITAEARDLKSGAERENSKWTAYFESQEREFITNYYNSIGAEPQFENDYLPESVEEMELYESLGGFKLKHEIAIETLIGHSFDISNWDDVIKRKVIEDLVVNNIGAVKEYTDIHTNKVKARYLDISSLIVPYDIEDEYHSPEFYGYLRLIRAAELRQHGIPEKRIKTYSQIVAGYYGNADWNAVTRYENNRSVHDAHAYDDFLIPVLECEWESVDTYYETERINRYGHKTITQEFFDTGKIRYEQDRYKNRDDKNINKINVTNKYQCSWIIDTQDIFGYGKVYDVARPNNEVKSAVHVFNLSGRSILERCRPNLDEIQIAWLKFQNAVAKAAPPGVAVEYDAISNISTGQGKDLFHPLEILKIRQQTGDLLYKVVPMGMGGNIRANAGKPIEPLEGGMGRALEEFNNAFMLQIGMIQQNTGVPAVADASNPDPRQPVKGSELALAATENTLRPVYDGYLSLKSRVAENIAYKIQLLIQQDPKVYKAYYPVVGKAKLQTLKVAKALSASDFGIGVEARATDAMKAEIKEQIKIGMQVGKEGQANLQSWQGVMLLNMIENGQSLKLVTAMLQYYQRKEAERLEQIRQANIAEQGEQKRLSDQQQAEIDLQKIEVEAQANKELEIIKGEQERLTNREKHLQKMDEILALEKVRTTNNANVPEAV